MINGRSFKIDREKHGPQDIVPNYTKRQQIEIFKTRFNPTLQLDRNKKYEIS